MSTTYTPLADFIEVRGHFRRSVQLEKDFAAARNGEFIVTPMARVALRRLAEGLGGGSPFRAWTLTGPYGVGKSAFAVFLSQLLCLPSEQSKRAMSHLDSADPLLAGQLRNLGLFGDDAKGYFPVLVTARRAAAAQCLAEGIIAAAAQAPELATAAPVRTLAHHLETQRNGQPWDTRRIVDAVSSFAESATAVGYRGLLFIVDELGKLFEFAARYPQKGDVFVLQELAELAARSGAHPLLLVGLLHQSFQEYGMHLDLSTRREWAKIQGRFEDIAYLEPAEQVMQLISHAISWKGNSLAPKAQQYAEALAATALQAGIAPPGMLPADFIAFARASYPLHPLTLVALPFLFRRFAQNERSLFSYLSNLEPYGFQEFIRTWAFSPDNPPGIRLSDLFDYFTRNFGAGLFRHPQALRWMEAADVLDRRDSLTAVQRTLVKTIGVLNSLGEFCHLNAREETIALAVADTAVPGDELRRALKALTDASVITYRRFNNSYRIWEGSDVDLEERIALGERMVGRGLDLADSVRRSLPPRPMVARRHSFETGALRHFSVDYLDDPDDIPAHRGGDDADGAVLVCLSESPAVAERFRACALAEGRRREVLFAIPRFIGELRTAVKEFAALRWAWENTPELRDDRVARRELSQRLSEADRQLRRQLEGLLDPRDEPVGSGCLWIHAGREAAVRTPVDVSHLLSDVCDAIYPASPHIRNELIVRRDISAASAAARRRLIELMLTNSDQENLGIEGYPPERSMYESVLLSTGIHRPNREGVWEFGEPNNGSVKRVGGVWRWLAKSLFAPLPEPIQLHELFTAIASPPYGVMPGLHPVLLCAFLLAHRDETTLYREGTFQPEPGIADYEVLMRRPELFAVTGSRLSGAREKMVQRLARGLGVKPLTVPVVRDLINRSKRLPEFAWNTRRLPESAIALRDAFLAARSPEQFLFVSLPHALGMPAVTDSDTDENGNEHLFATLNHNLRLLSEATDAAINQSRDQLLTVCGFEPGVKSWTVLRQKAVTLESVVTEPQLLTFLRRLSSSDSDDAGIESVLALVANRPPRTWNDLDVDRFPEAARALGNAFRAAVRSANVEGDLFAALTVQERRDAENIAIRVQDLLRQQFSGTSRQTLRAALTRLIEDCSNEK